jgi:methylaspartate ammonia-lyase
MKVQVLKGSKQQIAQSVAEIPGQVREVVVFVEDPSDTGSAEASDDIFAEMESFTVKAGDVDYSRESLYARQEGE